LLAATFNFLAQSEMSSEDRLFVVSPLASITGILQCVTLPCSLRACAVLEEKWDPVATCDFLLETGGTLFGGPDLVLARILDGVEARGLASTTLRAVTLGGAALDPRILSRVEDAFGIAVLRAYGSSEAPVSTSGHLRESREQRLADDGAALAGVEVRLGSGNDPGELCITGPHLFLGYLDGEDDVHAFETDDEGREWFCTGDVAELPAGRLKIVGRMRDIVIRQGLKVPISEVEAYMNAVPGIARAAGFAVADGDTGERLAVAIIPKDGARVRFDSVVGALSEAGLATWKLPEELVLWDEPFPENATGKVLRRDLCERSAGRPRLVAPRLQVGTSI
jgi:acyl-CoA synthetase (AMP-forming)/AMP-acid ligase II